MALENFEIEMLFLTLLLICLAIVLLKIFIKKKVCRKCKAKLRTVKIVGEKQWNTHTLGTEVRSSYSNPITYKFICDKCHEEYQYEDL